MVSRALCALQHSIHFNTLQRSVHSLRCGPRLPFGTQLLLPPANSCPIFASWTTQDVPAGRWFMLSDAAPPAGGGLPTARHAGGGVLTPCSPAPECAAKEMINPADSAYTSSLWVQLPAAAGRWSRSAGWPPHRSTTAETGWSSSTTAARAGKPQLVSHAPVSAGSTS